MNLTILTMGLNHATAPIQIRERVATAPCARDGATERLRALLDPNLFPEHLILSTCNRTEVYVAARDRTRGESDLRHVFTAHDTFSQISTDYLYTHANRDAAEHLFAVASGIDSMIVGEFEILGQVRAAYLAAAQKGTLGPILHQLFKDAIHIGKRAHSETAIGAGATSVGYAAVALARQHLGDLAGRGALVIGAGDMAERVAKNLAADGACMVVVANRTNERAADLARQIGGRAIPFADLPAALVEADFVVSATAAPHIILDQATIAAAMRQRQGNRLYLIDIAVPRDIDPLAAEFENVCLFNIDHLQSLVDANRAIREQAVTQVRAIIAEQTDSFWRWFCERRAAPVLSELRARAETIRAAELDKAMRRLGHLHLSERDCNVIATLSSGVVGKLLAAPTTNLKQHMLTGNGQVYLDALRELFELDEDEHDPITSTL